MADYSDVLARSSGEALLALSPIGEILWWGDGAAGVFGWSADEALHRSVFDLLEGATGDRPLQEVLAEVRRTHSAVWNPTVSVAGGEIVHIEAVLRLVQDRSWIAFAGRDVSDRTRLTRELLAQTWQLEEEAGRLAAALVQRERLAVIGELATCIEHDLRQPLTAIRNALHNVSRQLDPTQTEARVLQFVAQASHEIEVCEQTIGGLLDFAQDRPLRCRPSDLGVLVRGAVALAAPPARVTVEIACDDLPRVAVDAAQMRRVLLNLVVNACEAIPSSRAGTVRVVGEARDEGVELRIEDDGDGMAPEACARVFDPLFTAKRAGGGLGLAVAAHVVERHRGKLRVTSEIGGGTAFLLWLPSSPGL